MAKPALPGGLLAADQVAGTLASGARRLAHARLHFCVLLWGFTAILGRLISLPALMLVWWRILLVIAAVILLPEVRRSIARMPSATLLRLGAVGALLNLHWVTFYAAVKMTNASVAATCLSLAPIFLALIEPWVAKRRFDARELLLGVFVTPGMVLVLGGIPMEMRGGVWMGLLSALLVAVFGSFNKRFAHQASTLVVISVELLAGLFLLTAWASLDALFYSSFSEVFALPSARDWGYLALLSFGCTLLPFALCLLALRHLTAFSVQLTINLEPVYSIVFAVLLLGEDRQLSTRFYWGVAILLAGVVAEPWWKRAPRAAPSG